MIINRNYVLDVKHKDHKKVHKSRSVTEKM